MAGGSQRRGSTATEVEGSGTPKPKRVRTGCLTCRERHLKCDEGLPNCQNCRKSSRECKRGVRLNFIDTQVKAPPVVPPTLEWNVNFLDESRDIASEYKGGLSRYGVRETQTVTTADRVSSHDFSGLPPPAPTAPHQPLPPIQGMLPGTSYVDGYNMGTEAMQSEPRTQHGHSHSESSYSNSNIPTSGTSWSYSDQTLSPGGRRATGLQNPEEVLFMQVFVEEVGLWMDSMDSKKHFSRVLPFHAMNSPMLINAFLACGARHMTLVNSAYEDQKALRYYDAATKHLLTALHDPARDTVICATTAVILNVYEIMSEKALQRMNHIAGARALIKECGWNAKTEGIGAACFWLNVGMELLSCLHFNWQVAWDPDDWGVDMDFNTNRCSGQEELWTHRILYIVGKIANFRASIPRGGYHSSHRNELLRPENRALEWRRMKEMVDLWDERCPHTMHPLARLYPYQTRNSAFPEIWLVKRTTIVARLFYHTALVLLAQIHPFSNVMADESLRSMQQDHANQICGIVAHVKDRGVASVALRSLAIAGECLTVKREQQEVLEIFNRISKETGWRIGFVNKELPEKWAWSKEETEEFFENLTGQPSERQQMQQQLSHVSAPPQMQPQAQYQVPAPMAQQQHQHPHQQPHQQQQQPPATTLPPPPPTMPRIPSGILNPMLATADFSMPQHPYQSHWVAPIAPQSNLSHHLYYT
ncbi:hypothetical protein K402DRAFT_117502 [Aulographum hederae CBS 113979]|uniref:Zn(2)-C6 fungal-type domain-containing protein n=1 Tax=Aulographum hederae CBS 113979 TaxID=1176131 RepID=A0A6G1GVT8_9PEZI|nr:hypothetical protein K402DRAFT_117502 [Aulographum hederae CBS 113979]